MAREIPNPPHPTPNPDGPHVAGADLGMTAEAGSPVGSNDIAAVQAADHGTSINKPATLFALPIAEPDSLLIAHPDADMSDFPSPEESGGSTLLEGQRNPPRTSEIFRNVGYRVGDLTPSESAFDTAPASSSHEMSSDKETAFEGSVNQLGASVSEGSTTIHGGSRASDDDLSEPHFSWASVLLMSYSSAVTLALAWVVWTRQTGPPTESSPPKSSHLEAELLPKVASANPVGKLPPLPEGNVAGVGNKIQIGELEITPLAIELTPVSLIRSIDPNDRKHADSASLILRLRVRNVSTDHHFAPLENRFVREQGSAIDRSTIEPSHGLSINLFPLAIDSEWLIEGQDFDTLKPGETVETLIASEPDVKEKLTDDMTWRVRLRTGVYRTDVLGVRFDRRDVQEKAP